MRENADQAVKRLRVYARRGVGFRQKKDVEEPKRKSNLSTKVEEVKETHSNSCLDMKYTKLLEICSSQNDASSSFRPLTNTHGQYEDRLYFKNFPIHMHDNEVRSLFEPYGKISSFSIKSNEIGEFGIVQYGDPSETKEYGAICAKNALQALKGKQLQEGKKFFIRGFKDKFARDRETFMFAKKYTEWYETHFPGDQCSNSMHDENYYNEELSVE